MKLMVFYLLAVVSAVRGRYHEPYQQQGPTYPGNTYRSGGFRYHITHNYDTGSVPSGSSDPATGDSVVYASRLRPGRHVCSQYTQVLTPTSQVDTYSKPVFKPYRKPCAENRICNGYRMVHQTSYRPAYSPQTTRQVSYNCCPGWSQISKISHGCGRPLCSSSCQNGGSCVRPDSCSCAKGFTGSSCQTAVCSDSCQNGGSCVGPDSCDCPTGYTGPMCQTAVCSSPCMNGGRCIGPELCACPSGFTGQYCQTDIDECESKPCDQHCVNLPGSFECQCKTGFTLLEDGTSCRNCQDQFPTEARDLVDVEILAKRVQKLEEKRLRRGEILRVSSEGDNTVMGSGAGSNEMALEAETSGTLAELGRKMETFTQLIQDLKTQLTNVETRQQEQWKLIQKTKSSETIVRRVVPLCKQVSLMQQRMDQCSCGNTLSSYP